MLKRRPATPG